MEELVESLELLEEEEPEEWPEEEDVYLEELEEYQEPEEELQGYQEEYVVLPD